MFRKSWKYNFSPRFANIFITSRVWLEVLSTHESFTCLRLHQSKVAWHLRELSFQLILTIVFRTCSGDHVSASAFADLSFIMLMQSVTQRSFSLYCRVKHLTQLSFFPLYFVVVGGLLFFKQVINLLPLYRQLKYILQIFITLCIYTLVGTDVSFLSCTDVKTILYRQINIKCAVNSCRFP